MTEIVRAAVMQKPHSIGVQEFSVPDIEPGAALVRMIMSGICGTDKHMFLGDATHPSGLESKFPLIPGHENLALVEQLSERKDGWFDADGEPLKEGDRVVPACDVVCGECYACRNFYGWPWCEKVLGYGTSISCKDPPHLFGGWAEKMYILPKVFLFKVPEELPDKVAVLTEPMSVAYSSMARAMTPYWLTKEGMGPGDTVVIQGSGP
jgi:L-iditol 2-dehydrogenase